MNTTIVGLAIAAIMGTTALADDLNVTVYDGNRRSTAREQRDRIARGVTDGVANGISDGIAQTISAQFVPETPAPVAQVPDGYMLISVKRYNTIVWQRDQWSTVARILVEKIYEMKANTSREPTTDP